MLPSWSRRGSHCSQLGRYQFHSPSSFIADGASTARTSSTTGTAAADLTPREVEVLGLKVPEQAEALKRRIESVKERHGEITRPLKLMADVGLDYVKALIEDFTPLAFSATDAGTHFDPEIVVAFDAIIETCRERARPVEAYWRRILDSDPAVHGPAARAWHDTERILSEHTSGRVRLDPDALNSTQGSRSGVRSATMLRRAAQ